MCRVICYAKNITKLDPIELPPDDKALKYYIYSDETLQEQGIPTPYLMGLNSDTACLNRLLN
jgi:hypothetical protein